MFNKRPGAKARKTIRSFVGWSCACLIGGSTLLGASPEQPQPLRPASIRPISEASPATGSTTVAKAVAVVSDKTEPQSENPIRLIAGKEQLAVPPSDPTLPVSEESGNLGPLFQPVTESPSQPEEVTAVPKSRGPILETISDDPVAIPPSVAPLASGLGAGKGSIRIAQAAEEALPARPANGPKGMFDLTNPFETIGESGEVSLMVRRSKLMRTQVDIYRTAVVDASVVEVVQFTPREISLIGKSTGTTHVTFWFDQPGARPVTYLVRVEPDVERVKEVEDQYRLLEDVINEMYPDSKIELLVVADKLIVRGQAKDGADAGQIISLVRSQSGGRGGAGGGYGGGSGSGYGGGLGEGAAADVLSDSVTGSTTRSRLQVINMLRVPGIQQVSLRVKIAELNRSAARGFGVSVQGAINTGGSSKILLNSLVNAAGGAGPAILAQFDGDDISLGIKYLQESGVVKLLSEPTLVTMSGRPATFLAGGEFAVPTLVGGAGVNAVTTDFRSYGAVISFLPTVLDKDHIRLQVSPEFSQIDADTSVNGTPGLKTRSANTTVEMREGQTLAIAGLLSQSMTANKRGDLPFVSWLFGDRSVSQAETELIMLVTPDLVQPMDPEEVPPLPGFDVSEPTNWQFFLQGRLEGNPNYDYRSSVWPRLRKRYGAGGSSMISGPFGHGQ